MGDVGDLGDRHRALRPQYHAVGAAHLGRIALQQMGADAAHLVAQLPARAGDGTPRHDHAARGEGAEPEGGALGVAVAHRDMRRVDAELVRGDLRQRRLQPLAVRLDADHQHDAAVGQDPRRAALEPGDDRRTPGDEFRRTMRGLLGKGGKADADEPPVGLTPLLARTDPRQVQELSAETHALRIIAVVEAHAADRRERHRFGPHHVLRAHLDGVAPDRTGYLVDHPLDRKARPRTADPAIGAERRLVGRHGVMRPCRSA